MVDIDRGYSGWIAKHARSNYWRVASHIDIDDLIQDGMMHLCRLRQRYPDASPAHMMALLKRTYSNHIHDLAKKRTHSVDHGAASFEALLEVFDSSFSDGSRQPSEMRLREMLATSDDFDEAELLSSLPPNLRRLVDVLLSERGPASIWAPYRKCKDGTRETTQARLARLCGVDAGSELFDQLRDFLRGWRSFPV